MNEDGFKKGYCIKCEKMCGWRVVRSIDKDIKIVRCSECNTNFVADIKQRKIWEYRGKQ